MLSGEINWDAVGSVSEALGAMGVILTLLYLIRQIKQNTAATRSTAAAAYSQASMELAKVLGRVWRRLRRPIQRLRQPGYQGSCLKTRPRRGCHHRQLSRERIQSSTSLIPSGCSSLLPRGGIR